jgi:hypothetical protein
MLSLYDRCTPPAAQVTRLGSLGRAHHLLYGGGMRSSWLWLLSPALLLTARPADACSPPACWPGAFLPSDGSTIPENAPGLYWRPAYGAAAGTADPASVKLTKAMAPNVELPFTATALPGGDYLIAPNAPLVEGTAYVLEDVSTCGGTKGPRVSFMAGPSAPLPTSLGTMQTDPHGYRQDLTVASGSGSCATTIDATLFGIYLEPSADVAPWLPLLLFQTIVDDEIWAIQDNINNPPALGASWKGRGRDLLFRTCTANPEASYPGLASGGHQVAFRASLLNAQPIATPSLAVELMCDAIHNPDPDPDTDPDPDDEDCSAGCASTQPASGSLIFLVIAVLLRRRHRSC